VEVLIVMVHPLPFVNYIVHVWGLDTYCAYSSDAFITVFMMLRVYAYTPRMIAEASGLRNEKTRLVCSKLGSVSRKLGRHEMRTFSCRCMLVAYAGSACSLSQRVLWLFVVLTCRLFLQIGLMNNTHTP
jgi:hypothetical protein